MKIKLVLACFAVAGLAVSSAVAAPPEGKGKPRTGEGCKPKIAVVLKGTLVSATATSLNMNVTGANRWGRAWKTAGTASVTLDTTKTKVRGGGMKTIADLLAKLKAGDRVHRPGSRVQGRPEGPGREAGADRFKGHRSPGEGRERRRRRRLTRFPWEGTAAACD